MLTFRRKNDLSTHIHFMSNIGRSVPVMVLVQFFLVEKKPEKPFTYYAP